MVDSETGGSGGSIRHEPAERLDSWKRIAAYLKRDVSTVQRWERREGMPVHRHLHDKLGSVFAYRSELDEWWESRSGRLGEAHVDERPGPTESVLEPTPGETQAPRAERSLFSRRFVVSAGSATFVAAIGAGSWLTVMRDAFWRNPLAEVKFTPAAAHFGSKHAAAISDDGRFVAFLAKRDGETHVWLGEFGGDDYRNVTQDLAADLENPSVRTLGFSPDSSLALIWTRAAEGIRREDYCIMAAPTEGGALRTFLPEIAELDWSPDGKSIVYHTTSPGDPLIVREPGPGGEVVEREIFVAPTGSHCHYPVWSPDGSFIYFVLGEPGAAWDIWRIRLTGEGLERITSHATHVAHPVLLDRRTLVYLAKDADGSGPWVYGTDVERRVPHRLSSGLESYTSLSASRNGERFVATIARRRTSVWRLPVSGEGTGPRAGEPELLVTDGDRPRIGRDFLLFTATRGARHGIFGLVDGTPRELWSRSRSRIVGAPAVGPDGRRIAFTAEADGVTRLYVMDADGSNARVVADFLALRGNPAWWPDGQSLMSAVVRDGEPRLLRIPLNGDPPTPVLSEYSTDPAWSPDGAFFVYSGADSGTTFPLRTAAADGRPQPSPTKQLTRGARRVVILNDGTLIYMDGGIGHKDLWAADLKSGHEWCLAKLPPDFVIADFDVSADGAEIVVDRVEEDSELALGWRRQ